MIKATIVFGQDAVARYEETSKLPSKKWITENGGEIIKKEFHTRAEYNAYIQALFDFDGWYDYEIIEQNEILDESTSVQPNKIFFAFIWNYNHMSRDVSDKDLVEAWEYSQSASEEDNEGVYEVERLTLDELSERINDEDFAYTEDYVRFIEMEK